MKKAVLLFTILLLLSSCNPTASSNQPSATASPTPNIEQSESSPSIASTPSSNPAAVQEDIVVSGYISEKYDVITLVPVNGKFDASVTVDMFSANPDIAFKFFEVSSIGSYVSLVHGFGITPGTYTITISAEAFGSAEIVTEVKAEFARAE